MKQTSRREFLKLAGKGMLGAAALSTVPAMLPALAEGAEAPAWPWAYKKMDKEAVLKHGYECFYSHGGCCAGAVAAIVELLADEYGYPYNQLNARMFADGAGGYGAGTLCGSLGGACAVFGLFCEAKEAASCATSFMPGTRNTRSRPISRRWNPSPRFRARLSARFPSGTT